MALSVHYSGIKAYLKSLTLSSSDMNDVENVMIGCQFIRR